MKTALLYNQKAGKGLPARQTVERLCDFFAGDELLTADDGLEFSDLPLKRIALDGLPREYYPRIRAKVDGLIRAGAQRFVCVGGDGTAAYVCSAMYELGNIQPILGVAAGTANVGPIISVTLEQLAGRHVSQAREITAAAVAVLDEERFVSLAFNDLVVGDTFLGTVDGQTVNVSVRALLERGVIEPKTPGGHITGDGFHLCLNGQRVEPTMKDVRQIIVSGVEKENHYGRAVYGAVGKCDWSEKKAVIALCDYIAVSFEEDGAGVDRFSAMNYLIFGHDDRVSLHGFGPDACLVCDGNPYLPPCGSVQLRYEPELARIITL